MTQRIHLAAIVTNDERLLLVRPQIGAPWELPGAPFRDDDDDMDAAMAAALMGYGIVADAIEEDFFETVFMGDASERIVYNIYAPSVWAGEPRAPAGASIAWFAVAELDDIDIDDPVRHTVLRAFGIERRPDTDAQIMEAMRSSGPSPVAAPQHEAPVASHRPAEAEAGLPPPPPLTPPDPATPAPASTSVPGHDPRLARGRDVLRTLNAGDEAAEANLRARAPELADDILVALGETWARPVIDRRTRSLQVVAMLAALGRTGPLRSHVAGALNHGATPAQVIETMRTVAVYAGFPAALEAWAVMEEVFAARQIGEEARRP